MEKIKEIFSKITGKDKKNNMKIVLFGALGLVLMLYPVKEKAQENVIKDTTYVSNEVISNDSYIENEEKRIEEFISNFQGVSKVKVLLSLSSGKEKILAKEIKETKNQSQEGIALENDFVNKSVSYEENTIFKSDDNPYVQKENEPSLRGIVILVRGNISSSLVANIKESMKAYLCLPINKVKVYEMKG